jgi:hypothetical protein
MPVPDRSSWGNSSLNANDAPEWNYLNNEMRGSQANVVATGSGWAIEHPWGPGGGPVAETIVAIGGLSDTAQYPAFGVVRYALQSAQPGHSNSEHIKVFVQLNKGVEVQDANTANVYIVAIGGNANTGNVNLVYQPAESDPKAGELVFEVSGADLSLDITGETLTVNASSVLHGAGGAFKSLRKPNYTLALTGSLVITLL